MAELKKVLNYPVLLLIVINSIMGTGIFFLPAIGAMHAGPSSIFSWLILSVIAIYIAMVFGELTSMFPKAGGVYEFAKQAYGRVPSFIVGWITLIGGNITIAMLIIGAISYLLPPSLPQLEIVIMLISAVFIFAFNMVAYRGMKTSATMLVTFSFVTLITLFALIVPSALNFNPGNFSNLFDQPVVIFLAIFFIAETFFGWESPTFLAGETKDGHKVVPKALVHGTIIISIISLLFVFFAIGAMGPVALGESAAPLSDLAQFNFGDLGRQVFMLLVYLAIIGSVADWVVSAPRLILSMAKDKLFLPQFGRIHPKFHTPHMAIIFQAVVSIIFIFLGLGSYTALLHLLVPILLVMYSLVMFALVRLRYTRPHLKRYYKVPFGKVGPLIIILFFFGLLITWVSLTPHAYVILLRGVTLMLFGIPLYFLLEMYYNPRAIRFVEDALAYFSLLTERFALPVKVRKEIVRILGNIKGKVVLDFGCSVGTMTMHLAEEVGKNGKIWATDLSKKEVLITRKRVMKKRHHHVRVLHDLEHTSRLHPDVPNVHTIVSVGSLGYLQDPIHVLKQMNKRLRRGSKICFVDYDKFFDIIPNKEWLRNDAKIKQLFRKAGFNVQVMRKQGFAWQYIYIYGVKEK
ncbi:amino acid permease [Candidatus Woesearchaeota archaeon]|nr:amino acid permease [Candidatus Woesearchaeota archaeon]